MLYKQFALMVLFNDAFAEGEAKSPATFFGGETRLEDPGNILFADPLTRVGHIHNNLRGLIFYADGQAAFSFHGIQRIL